MLRDLLRFLVSRVSGQPPLPAAEDPALSDTYRVVPDPQLCFQFEPLTDEGTRRYAFGHLPDYWTLSREEAATAQTFPPRVTRLDQGSVLGLSFLPVTRDKLTCLNFFIHNPGNPDKFMNSEVADTVRHVATDSIAGRFDGLDRYDEGVLVGNHWNFGHWLYNHLARLALVASAPRLEGVPLVVGENILPSHLECLERMGFPDPMLIRLRKGRLARFRTLWVPTMPLCGFAGRLFWSPGTIDFLRDRLGVRPDARARPGRRLYVTRRTTRWRRVLNEDDVVALLSLWGFEVIDPGALSIAQQIEIASEAEVIMGPFGAGMNLLLFAPRDATIVELNYQRGRMDIDPVICRHIGQRFMPVMGSPVVAATTELNHDFTVAPDHIKNALETAGFQR